MLQTIREHTQGWIAGVIIAIIILTFALWGIRSYFVGGVNDSVVAKVNGVAISKEQLAVRYERLRRQLQSQYNSVGEANLNEANLKNRALQDLIAIEVLKQASAHQGFAVSDTQVDSYLQSMPDFQVNGQFSLERFQDILSTTLLSTSEFLDLIRTNLLVDQPKLGVLLSSFVMPDETAYDLSLVNQQRDIDYLIVSNQPVPGPHPAIAVTAQQIQTYYDAHKNDFLTPEQVSVDYLQLSLQDIAAHIEPTDAMLKNFYGENINAYTEPMRWKLTDIEIPLASDATQNEVEAAKTTAASMMQALQSGQHFDQVAKGYVGSLTPKNWLTLNQLPPELQPVVASLTKSQQISAPVRTKQSIVIVQVVDVQEPQIEPFDTVKASIRKSFVEQRAEEKFAELRDQLADLTYEHPDSLAIAAKALSLSIQTSALFTRDKAGAGVTQSIAQSKKVRDVAFTDDVLNLQNNSDVIQTSPDSYVVLRINSHIVPRLLPLTDVTKQIEFKLKAEALQAEMAQYAKNLTQQLQAGADPAKLAADNNLTWTQAGFMGRHAGQVDSAILDLAFRLPNPAHQASQGDNATHSDNTNNYNTNSYGMTRVPNGYAIVALKEVKSPDIAAQKQEYGVFAEQGQNSEGLLEYQLYRQSMMDHAKIKISQ